MPEGSGREECCPSPQKDYVGRTKERISQKSGFPPRKIQCRMTNKVRHSEGGSKVSDKILNMGVYENFFFAIFELFKEINNTEVENSIF